jgi:hypothetical protein
MHIQTIRWVVVVALAGCAASQQPPQAAPTDDPVKETPERKALTQEQCEAQAGRVVGDIGDGAIRRPGYLCTSGKPPLGDIASPAGGPIASEGSVCCPR